MTNTKIYHTITFDNGEKCWGYPLPHLLAMHHVPIWFAGELMTDSDIELIFSTEKIIVHGSSMELLWEKLVMQEDLEIKLGRADGGYFVDSIIPALT